MKLYTCCPHETCGAFQMALKWLKSHGIEPALESDEGHHFFEFSVPGDWETQRRIEFNWELANKTSGMVFCRCERWLDEDATGQAGTLICRSCGQEYLFCQECDSVEEWSGCDCQRAGQEENP